MQTKHPKQTRLFWTRSKQTRIKKEQHLIIQENTIYKFSIALSFSRQIKKIETKINVVCLNSNGMNFLEVSGIHHQQIEWYKIMWMYMIHREESGTWSSMYSPACSTRGGSHPLLEEQSRNPRTQTPIASDLGVSRNSENDKNAELKNVIRGYEFHDETRKWNKRWKRGAKSCIINISQKTLTK